MVVSVEFKVVVSKEIFGAFVFVVVQIVWRWTTAVFANYSTQVVFFFRCCWKKQTKQNETKQNSWNQLFCCTLPLHKTFCMKRSCCLLRIRTSFQWDNLMSLALKWILISEFWQFEGSWLLHMEVKCLQRKTE